MLKEIDINITPEEMARLFWEMDSNYQAKFLIDLNRITSNSENHPGVQWLAIKDSLDELPEGDKGFEIIRDIYVHIC